MIENLYLVLRPGKWNHPRIAKVCKKPPAIHPGSSAVMVKIVVQIADSVMIPKVPVATIQINEEHVKPAEVKATVVTPS